MNLTDAQEELASAQKAIATLKNEAQSNNTYLQEIEGKLRWYSLLSVCHCDLHSSLAEDIV